MLLAKNSGLVGRQPTLPVRPRHDAQWTAFGAAVVEMDAHGDEGLQQVDGRLGIQNALLLGPPGAIGMRDLVLDGDAEILMEPDEPVGFRRFVEQRALHRHGSWRKQRRDRRVGPERRRKLLAARQIEKIPRPGPSASGRVEGARDVDATFWSQNAWKLREARLVECREGWHPANEEGPGPRLRETSYARRS